MTDQHPFPDGQNDDLETATDPFALFAAWMSVAEKTEPNDPNAMTVATVDPDGLPDARILLLKGFDDRGFVFYTNLESAKGQQLLATHKVALVFHWKSLHRQVRARGPVEPVTEEEADIYFNSRRKGSRIGAWASQQSRPLESRDALLGRVTELEAQYPGDSVPRPPHWSGFRLKPTQLEFWRDGEFRLHDRFVFTPTPNGGWEKQRLNP